jgi:SAM-dependent methyltransferase
MNRLHRWYCGSPLWRRHLHGRILPALLPGVSLHGDVLEVGPGRGLTTERLLNAPSRLVVLEIDQPLAAGLAVRFANAPVAVVVGTGSRMPFSDARFDTVVTTTALHHVRSRALQDQLLAEAHRVLRPGGCFTGSDSRTSLVFRLAHFGDVLTVVDPDTFQQRLVAAGFRDPVVSQCPGFFTFRAWR